MKRWLINALLAAVASGTCSSTIRAESAAGMSGMDFLLIRMESLPPGDVLPGLKSWSLRRNDGSADADAFDALLYFIERLETPRQEGLEGMTTPIREMVEYLQCRQTIVDAFYMLPTPELSETVARALASSQDAERRAGLAAAVAAMDSPEVRSALLELARREGTAEERGRAVAAILALGESRARETLEKLRALHPASPALREAAATAEIRLSAALGEWRVPPIDANTRVPSSVQIGLNLSSGFALPTRKPPDPDATVLTYRNGNFSPETAAAFYSVLNQGGTVFIMNPGARDWPADLAGWAAENGVALPTNPRASEGPGVIHYPDYRTFCDFPYPVSEEEGNAADHAWWHWSEDQAAPLRSMTGKGALVVVQEKVLGQGRIVFTTVDVTKKHVYRQNFLRWLYGDALLARPAGYQIPRYEMDPERTTPHRAWAPDWALGIPRVMWISDEPWKRGLIETRQRVAMNWSFAPYDAFPSSSTAWSQAGTTGKGATGPGLMGQRAVALVESNLADLDALVMDTGVINLLWGVSLVYSREAAMNFDTLPRYLRRRVLRRVREGMGLVVLKSPTGDRTPGEDRAGLELQHFIAPLLPFENSGEMAGNISVTPLGEGVIVETGLDFRHLNKMGSHRSRELPPAFRAPGVLRELSRIDREEYRYAMLGKLILWAAGKDGAPRIDTLAASGGDPGAKPVLRLDLSESVKGSVAGTLRNRYNESIPIPPFAFEGAAAVVPLPEILPEGAYVAEIAVKNAAGETIDFGAVRLASDLPVAIKRVESGAAFHREGDVIEIDVSLSAPFDGVAVLDVRDNYGRRVHSETKRLASEESAFRFNIPVENPLSRLWEAELVLKRGERVIARVLHPLGIALPPPPLDFDTEGVMPAAALQTTFRDELAVNLIIGDPDTALRRNFDFSSGSWWMSIGGLTTPGAAPEPNVRTPCFSNPAFRNRVIRDLREKGPLMASLGIDNYMIGDEVGLGPSCFCSHSMDRFRERLRREYDTLENLNREWGSAFESWSAVRPMQGEDPQRPGSRVDYRRFQLWEFAEYCNLIEIAAGDYVPGFTAGHSGGMSGNTLLELSGWLTYYGVQEHVPAVMRRPPPQRMIGSWFRPGYSFREDHEAQCRHWPWWHLLRGTTRMNLWYTAPGGSPAIHGDLRPYQAFVWLGEEMRELRGNGIGKLLRRARRDEGRVAVYHSERNRLVRNAVGETGGTTWKDGPRPDPVFLSLGIECRAISEYQVERGDIGARGLKLLFLPSIVSLSSGERAELRRFVREGGILVADFAPGLRNEHGTWTGDAFARELFGIEASEGALEIEPATARFTAKSPEAAFPALRALGEWQVSRAGSGVKPTDGTVLAGIGEGRPALVVKPFGEGRGVLLNFPFPPDRNGVEARALARDLAGLAGVAPVVELDAGEEALPAVDFGIFRDGEAFYAGLAARGDGGMIASERTFETRVTFPERRHLYDVRAGRYLGETDQADWTLTPGIARLFAGLPARVQGLRLAPARKSGRPGETLEIDIVADADAEVSWRQVLRVRVMRPDGTEEPAYAHTFLAENGRAVLRLPLALDAPTGDWILTLRDAATGIEGFCTIGVVE